MHAVLYTRISQDATGERAGVSRQLDDCTLLAEKIGATVVNHFDDNDISAFNGKTRPGFEAMLDMLKRGEADAIIVWHPDRLYRSMKDLERLIDVVDTAGSRSAPLTAATSTCPTAPAGCSPGSWALCPAKKASTKVKGIAAPTNSAPSTGSGEPTSRCIFGYTQRGEPLEPEATAVRQAIHDVLGGRSLRSIAAAWNEPGYAHPKPRSAAMPVVESHRAAGSDPTRSTPGCGSTKAK